MTKGKKAGHFRWQRSLLFLHDSYVRVSGFKCANTVRRAVAVFAFAFALLASTRDVDAESYRMLEGAVTPGGSCADRGEVALRDFIRRSPSVRFGGARAQLDVGSFSALSKDELVTDKGEWFGFWHHSETAHVVIVLALDTAHAERRAVRVYVIKHTSPTRACFTEWRGFATLERE